MEEALERGSTRLAHALEGGPALQEVTEQQARRVVEPVQRLRKVVLQRIGEAIGDAGLIIDETPAHLHELFERSHLRTLWVERSDLLGMLEQKVQSQLS